MANLLDELKAFFDTSKSRTDEEKARNAIAIIQGCGDPVTLAQLLTIVPGPLMALAPVAAAYSARETELNNQGDRGIYGPIAKALYEGFADLSPVMTKAATDALQSGFVTATPSANALAASIADPLVGAMVQIMQAGGQKVPDDVQARLKSVLLPALSMGLTLEIATNLAELIHPTKEMGFPGISHFIHDTVGFAAMSEAYVYPIRKALVEIPTEKNIMHLTQPRHPPTNMARDFTQKRMMTVEEYADDLRFDGIMEDAVQMAKDTVWREMSMRDMQRMFDVGRPDNTWIQKKVIRMGFRDEDVDKIVTSLNQRAVTAEIGSLKALQRSQYKDGVLTREEYAAKLAARGITAAESKEFLDAVDDEIAYDQNKDLQAGYELKFLNGRATEVELRAALASLKMQTDKIETRVKYLTVKKLGKLQAPETEKVLSRADIVKLYAAGRITKQDAAKRLDDMGWLTADAMSVMDLADLDQLDAVRAETIRAAEQKVANLRMPIADLDDVYVANGKSAAWAAARVAYIEQTVLGKVTAPKPVNVNEEQDAVRAETIRAAEQEAKNLRLDAAGLKAVYLANGKTEAWAVARVAYIGELVLGKEKASSETA
jgi:hypothetical protein